MYIQIRTIDCKSSGIINISKLTTVPDVKAKICEVLNILPEKQRLFYRGKQLEDGYKMFDYDVKLNDVIQIMIKPDATPTKSANGTDAADGGSSTGAESQDLMYAKPVDGCNSLYYKPGDMVDAVDLLYGAWFEAKVVGFAPSTEPQHPKSKENLVYVIQFDRLQEGDTRGVLWDNVRPQARETVKLSKVKVADRVMVNFNVEVPTNRGYWYDVDVTAVSANGRNPRLVGTVIVGVHKAIMPEQQILFLDEIMRIEEPKLIEERSDRDPDMSERSETPRKNGLECTRCRDVASAKCKHCGCCVCGGKNEPDKILMCDECDDGYHLWCLTPPLEGLPEGEDDWYCPGCKNDENEIVRAGDGLKESKKKAKMASSVTKGSRDWGTGMACVGRSKVCTIVGAEHFGAIPGVEVGSSWKFRVQVSEDGVHRPHVAGISGRTTAGGGAFSLVLSGGYEDDVDNGDSFMYTGSGGRDLSGNKRTNKQSTDQTLTRFNLALAMNCNAKVDPTDGATADDWKGGKPVRVVRNYKLAKHSKYAPDEGNRYDGLYKVIRYWPEVGKSGFKVWRYELRRDDKSPAPWTPRGRKHIEELGLAMKYPDGYLEAEAAKEAQAKKKEEEKSATRRSTKRQPLVDATPSPNTKRAKLLTYKLDRDVEALVSADVNTKLWALCKETLAQGKSKFMEKVTEVFSCICCQELVFEPVTTECMHNICKSCLKRSFAAEVYTCPLCRHALGEDYQVTVNTNLGEALVKLFPGYEVGR